MKQGNEKKAEVRVRRDEGGQTENDEDVVK